MKKNCYLKIMGALFMLSIPFLTLLLCGSYSMKHTALLVFLSFITGIFLWFKIKNIFECDDKSLKNKLNIHPKYFISSIIIAGYTNGILMNFSNGGILFLKAILKKLFRFSLSFEHTLYIVSFLSIFSMMVIIYVLLLKVLPFIKKEYQKITKVEKRYLTIMILFGFIFTGLIYFLTNAFYLPKYDGKIILFDVLYTTDSGAITNGYAYLNIGMAENDLRQPLFGLMAIPFALSANFISMFLEFIPNSYFVIFNTIQILLIALSFVLIGKMMNLTEKQKPFFYLFSICTFPIILFSFIAEQYVIAFFYLILAIYIGYYHLLKANYLYIGAVGTLLTSGIIFPLISQFQNAKKWITNTFKCFIAFLITMILSGQILQFLTFHDQMDKFMGWSGKELLFGEKLGQFLNFVKSIFIAPSAEVVMNQGVPLYHLDPVSGISILGVMILIVCFISFIMNRKNKIAIISFLWIVFSFLLLCVFGWGTKENGLILYSLYFAWAYLVLIYLFIKQFFHKEWVLNSIIIFLSLIMLVFNLKEFIQIIEFGIHYYH